MILLPQVLSTEGCMSSAPPIVPSIVPIPPLGASEQDMRGVIRFLTQLVAAQAQRQSVEVPDAA
ncbi:hypothetical protein KY290_005305 [Solanum tuberosum]|uniref:Uncharacterized protein n=1 Tax=Solanum tuberosum TaxID=4113 RepID=A0ABQ7WDV2_SOLTU|nr:hypothetical protein KY290_005305 [Solanum tuberosum]